MTQVMIIADVVMRVVYVIDSRYEKYRFDFKSVVADITSFF